MVWTGEEGLTCIVYNRSVVKPVELADVVGQRAGEADGTARLHEQLTVAGDIRSRLCNTDHNMMCQASAIENASRTEHRGNRG